MLFFPKGLPQIHQQESTAVNKPCLLRHAHAVYVPHVKKKRTFVIKGLHEYMGL